MTDKICPLSMSNPQMQPRMCVKESCQAWDVVASDCLMLHPRKISYRAPGVFREARDAVMERMADDTGPTISGIPKQERPVGYIPKFDEESY